MRVVYWLRGEAFVELARLSIASIRKACPDARIHTWTDEPNSTPAIADAARHVLQPGRPAMVANLDAQIDALNYFDRGERVLFLDADVLVRRDFPWSLLPDLYVTWRSHVNHDPALEDFCRTQPYNYGVVGCINVPQIQEAFYWMRARILQMNARNQAWHGNQLALAELVGAPPTEGQADKDVRVRWSLNDRGTALCVRQLPCDIWNYTPEGIEDVSRRAAIHLKGDRKDLMQHYAAELAA